MSKTKIKNPRKYASSVKLRLGVLTCEGALYPVQRDDKPKTELVTKTGEKPKQVYQDSSGNVYEFDELDRKVIPNDSEAEEMIVTNDQLKAAKDKAYEDAKNILSMVVHDSSAEHFMFPADKKAYVFIPDETDKENVAWYGVLREVIGGSDKVFVSEARVSRSAGFWRIRVWNGQIVVQQHCFPNSLNEYDVLETASSEYGQKMISAIDKLVSPFDPENYTDVMGEALMHAADTPVEEKPDEADIGAALDSFLDSL